MTLGHEQPKLPHAHGPVALQPFLSLKSAGLFTVPFDAHDRGRKGLTHVHAFKNAFVSREWARDTLCASPSWRLPLLCCPQAGNSYLPRARGPDSHFFGLELVIQEDL